MELNDDPEFEAFIEGFDIIERHPIQGNPTELNGLHDVSHLQVSRQEAIEAQYNRKHLDAKVRAFLMTNEQTQAMIRKGQRLLLKWLVSVNTYDAKTERKNLLVKAAGLTSEQVFDLAIHTLSDEELSKLQLEAPMRIGEICDGRPLNEQFDETAGKLTEVVLTVFTCTAALMDPMPLVSVAAILAPRFGVDKPESLKSFCDYEWGNRGEREHLHLQSVILAGELLAILCETDAFDLVKPAKYASISVENCIALPMRLTAFMLETEYLPPMVCRPLELTHNFSSGYLTHNDSLILRSGNHHDGEICLDVLNTMNNVALALDPQFLSTVEEEPKHAPETELEARQWQRFKQQSYRFYLLMMRCGNRFFFCHKVDKRGRIYACGFHINSQGAPFKKAMIELANKELVIGAPV